MNDKEYLLSVLALIKPFVKQMKNKAQKPQFREAYRTLTILKAETEQRIEDLKYKKPLRD